MSEANVKKGTDGAWSVSGELSMETVPGLLKQNPWSEVNGDNISIDLQAVERADSAGVALLIEWQRAASKQQQTICFQNIPSQMRAIARLSGVDELLLLS